MQRRLDRIARARELAAELGIDAGVAEGTLLALERSPSERLARGLMRGRWAKVPAVASLPDFKKARDIARTAKIDRAIMKRAAHLKTRP